MSKIKIFLVDDSVIVRQGFTKIFEAYNEFELVGTAQDPLIAMKKIIKLDIDLMILDIEMPNMDGLTYLKKLMSETPMPVVICSTVAQAGSHNSYRALELGAVDVIPKPTINLKNFFTNDTASIINTLRVASKSKVKKLSVQEIRPVILKNANFKKDTIVAIGSSTGGIQIIEQILSALPQTTPPILIVQHMPAGFTKSMANRLNQICKVEVREAQDKEEVKESVIYISPGDRHMTIEKAVSGYRIAINEGPKVSHHKPSIDILFRSVAKVVGRSSKAFILTGMGFDGASGIKILKIKAD